MRTHPGWHVVLPVKGGSDAKSRMGLGSDGPALALAMALDCVEAVLATPAVSTCVVVTADPWTADAAHGAGAVVVRQPADRPGLSGAVAAGLATVGGPVAVLLADLPSLTAHELSLALDAVDAALQQGATSAFVPDAEDFGTVLLAARQPSDVTARFGGASAAAHEAVGARRLNLPLQRLRRDVDTTAGLRTALELGIGRRTLATLRIVQTTVLTFDRATGTGTVVTDDGVEMDLAPDALSGSGLQHLRPGQRITCAPSPDHPTAVHEVRIHGISG